VGDQLAALRAAVGDNEAAFAEQAAPIFADARREVAMAVRRFVADETGYGMVAPDARSTRTTTWGQRPGTVAGEAIRYLMQFKSFPIAWFERVWGRAIYGHRPGEGMSWNPASWTGEQGRHIGTLLAGLLIAGYVSMSLKDVLKGYWPPRNPADPRTIVAALQQAGAIGIYGDYLFAQNNRFGGDALETAAGPTIGSVGQLLSIYSDALGYATTGGTDPFSGANALNVAIGNMPFANLHLARPVLNYLFLNSLHEALSPGWMKRQISNRQKQYGQSPIATQLGGPVSLDPFNIARSY
jgi:hypothetical protein